ncbi:MAG: GAD-like domain-containing protein [Paracoccus sp. (in: a-proteobacteria)]|nr:GAD-like domain-containing protein [Paracoccus sp. (in: a-proteobacteria)]
MTQGDGDKDLPEGIGRMIARWGAHVPALLVETWRLRGLVDLAGGRLRLCDPGWLAPLMSYLFEGDVDLDGDCHAIAIGNLGEVVIWSERHGFGLLSPVLSTLTLPYLLTPVPPAPDAQIRDHVLGLSERAIEAFDPDGEPVHDRLVERFGPLEPGMIYGATPVPPRLGGTPVKDYVIADAAEWLEAVYTEMAVSIFDYDRDPQVLRMVGEDWPAGLRAASRGGAQ